MADPTYLYIHQMDETDFNLYRTRLGRAWQIIDEADDIVHDKKNKETRYRIPTNDGHMIAHVSRIVDRQGRPYFRLWTDHTDGTSNFTITDPLRFGEKDLKPEDPDSVLDHLEILMEDQKNAFAERGPFGATHREKIEAMDAQSLALITALIHAYLEFEPGRRFCLETHATKPYKPSSFFEIIDGQRFEFLGERMVKRLDWFIPSISKLEYRRRDGMSFYDVGPMEPTDVLITGHNVPTDDEIMALLHPLADVPQPHLLDHPQMTRVYGW